MIVRSSPRWYDLALGLSRGGIVAQLSTCICGGDVVNTKSISVTKKAVEECVVEE